MEELRAELAAAKTDAEAVRAELTGARKHTCALEKQLRGARSGASLQDIQAVSGRDNKLVGARALTPVLTPLVTLHLCLETGLIW